MISANEGRVLLNNMLKSSDTATKQLGEAVRNMAMFDPNSENFVMYTQEDVERAINILQSLKLRLGGWTHPGCNGLEW